MKIYIGLHFSIFERVLIDLGVLFQRSLLERYVEGFSDVHPDETPILDIVQKWIDFFRGRTDLGESNLEQAFNEDFFINILGYVGPPSEQFNFLPKQTASEGQIIPDFLMGTFVLKEGKLIRDIRRVVGELKGPKASF